VSDRKPPYFKTHHSKKNANLADTKATASVDCGDVDHVRAMSRNTGGTHASVVLDPEEFHPSA
jgi:hypothetical protein